MLTGDLLRARVRGKELHPSFIQPTKAQLVQTAGTLLDAYATGVREGWKRSRLEEEVGLLIGDRSDHKTIRGLNKLVLDRCEFTTASELDPAEVRLRVFTRAREMGPVALERGLLDRCVADDVYAVVAKELGHSVESLRAALYADLKQEQTLLSCSLSDPTDLLHRYNVGLVQSLLLKAIEVRVTLHEPSPARLRQLFRHIKFHQLIHRARIVPKGLEVVLDGPVSLFSQSTRYGLQLATFLPALLLQECHWTLSATVLWTKARHKKKLLLTHEAGLRSHYTDRGGYATREQEGFADRFNALDSGWKLKPGAAPIALGPKHVLLPDFTLRRGKRVVHLEILGFWRREQVEAKLERLRAHGKGNVLLAVSRKRRGSKGAWRPEGPEVVEFAEIIPAKKVLAAAEALVP